MRANYTGRTTRRERGADVTSALREKLRELADLIADELEGANDNKPRRKPVAKLAPLPPGPVDELAAAQARKVLRQKGVL